MIHTVTSSQGGVFSIFVDDFNTTDVIDTFSGSNSPMPLCYPVQFPPFLVPPPTLASQNNHLIELIYSGPSPNAPSGTTEHSGQFDAFAIPDLLATPFSASGTVRKGGINGVFLSVLLFKAIVLMMYPMM